MRRQRRLKQRLFWAGVLIALSLLALAGIIVRTVESLHSAARTRLVALRAL